jgi:hypothetical protein
MTLTIKNIFPDVISGVDPYAANAVFEIRGTDPIPSIGSLSLQTNNSIVINNANGGLSNPSLSTGYYLDYGINSSVNLGTIFTIEAVIRSPVWYVGTSYYSANIVCKSKNTGTPLEYLLLLYNGNISFYTNNYVNSYSWIFTPANNIDYYIEIICDGTNITCYVNGLSYGSRPFTAITDTNTNLYLIGNPFNADSQFLLKAFRITKAIRNITGSIYPVYV